MGKGGKASGGASAPAPAKKAKGSRDERNKKKGVLTATAATGKKEETVGCSCKKKKCKICRNCIDVHCTCPKDTASECSSTPGLDGKWKEYDVPKWTGKLPHTLLQEWCQKNKRRKPSYQNRKSKEEGMFMVAVGVQVGEEDEKNTVVWPVDPSPTPEIAKHRAALVGLSKLHPKANFRTILPRCYADEWTSLQERHVKEEKKAEREAVRAERAEKRAERVVRQEKTKLNREDVVMNPAMQESTISMLRELSVDSATSSSATKARFHAQQQRLLQQLTRKGFYAEDCASAFEANPEARNVDDLQDWLCLHIPKDRLPDQYKKLSVRKEGAATTITIVKFEKDDSGRAQKGGSGVPKPKCLGDWAGLKSAAKGSEWAELRRMFVRGASQTASSMGFDAAEELSMMQSFLDDRCKMVKEDLLQIDVGTRRKLLVHSLLGNSDPYSPVFVLQDSRLASLPLPGRLYVTQELNAHANEVLKQSNEIISEVLVWTEENADRLISEATQKFDPSVSNANSPGAVASTSSTQSANTSASVAGTGSDATVSRDYVRASKAPSFASDLRRVWIRPSGNRRSGGRASNPDAEDSKVLQKSLKSLRENAAGKFVALQNVREGLPAWKSRARFIDMLKHHQVVVVAGETGCGKTTQIPQAIFENMVDAGIGGKCRVICTQPRRISATSVAERVAVERGESGVGGLVGYHIRMEKKCSTDTRLLFCTTGLLLRQLQSDETFLDDISHVIIDEVHERSVESDLLMAILKRRLNRHRSLRLVLMSATVSAEKFATYFSQAGSPVFQIPGRTFPVQRFYYEDVIEKTKHFSAYDDYDRVSEDTRRAVSSFYGGKLGSRALACAAVCAHKGVRVRVDYEAIVDLVRELIVGSESHSDDDGSILIFMTGRAEIENLLDRIQSDRVLGRGSKSLWLLPLHASLSANDQSKVFSRPPKGCRKVIVSTNIAETSITIDDVTVVIDTGRAKINAFDALNGHNALVENLIAQSNATQRAGRAGRVRPGRCYHMFTRYEYEKVLREFPRPEIHRIALDSVCLNLMAVESMNASGSSELDREVAVDVYALLKECLDAPSRKAISSALSVLSDVGAVDWDAEDRSSIPRLTSLGHHLAGLPLDVRVGKMLLYACLFGCLDPVLTIAAALNSKSPYVTPFNDAERDEATARQQDLGVADSDHMSLCAVFEEWERIRRLDGNAKAKQFCHENYLDAGALRTISGLRGQLRRSLDDTGMLSLQEVAARTMTAENEEVMVRAILCAGLYPNVAQIVRTRDKNAGNIMQTKFKTKRDGWIRMHPSSCLSSARDFRHQYLVFYEKIRTSALFIRDGSVVSPYPLLLFGRQIDVKHTDQEVVIDGFIRFNAPPQTAVLFKGLRSQLDSVLSDIVDTESALTEEASGRIAKVLSLVVKLLRGEKKAIKEAAAMAQGKTEVRVEVRKM